MAKRDESGDFAWHHVGGSCLLAASEGLGLSSGAHTAAWSLEARPDELLACSSGARKGAHIDMVLLLGPFEYVVEDVLALLPVVLGVDPRLDKRLQPHLCARAEAVPAALRLAVLRLAVRRALLRALRTSGLRGKGVRRGACMKGAHA